MSIAELNAYEARMAAHADTWLGAVAWYTVNQTKVPYDAFVEALTLHGLEEFKPGRPADVDVFRRVTSDAEVKKQPTADPDVYENVLVRSVSESGGDEVIRRIVSETVNSKGRRLRYTESVDVRFYRDSKVMRCVDLIPDLSPAVRAVVARIRVDYPAWRGCVNGDAIRSVINRALDGSQSTSLRPGVFFVPRRHMHVMDGLEGLAAEIPGVTVHSIPLPDDDRQRDMLRDAFEAEAAGAIDKAIDDARQLLGGGVITEDKVSGFMLRLRELQAKAGEYTALLETNLTTTAMSLETLARQVGLLAQRTG